RSSHAVGPLVACRFRCSTTAVPPGRWQGTRLELLAIPELRERLVERGAGRGLDHEHAVRADHDLSALAMDAAEVDQARAGLAAGKSAPLAKLTAALSNVDAELLRAIPELEAFATRLQTSGERSYDDAMYVLAGLALHADVSPAVFVHALR